MKINEKYVSMCSSYADDSLAIGASETNIIIRLDSIVALKAIKNGNLIIYTTCGKHKIKFKWHNARALFIRALTDNLNDVKPIENV